MHTFRYDPSSGGLHEHWVDGVAGGTRAGAFSFGTFHLGNRSSYTSPNANVSEVLIYERALGEQERVDLEAS
ncbi:hypothetical protein MLD52_23160, partial [Puniceicoccaceae bacterium K14]|nr:hypothetical protein [Puniceicoccaceae bacterium K14]